MILSTTLLQSVSRPLARGVHLRCRMSYSCFSSWAIRSGVNSSMSVIKLPETDWFRLMLSPELLCMRSTVAEAFSSKRWFSWMVFLGALPARFTLELLNCSSWHFSSSLNVRFLPTRDRSEADLLDWATRLLFFLSLVESDPIFNSSNLTCNFWTVEFEET